MSARSASSAADRSVETARAADVAVTDINLLAGSPESEVGGDCPVAGAADDADSGVLEDGCRTDGETVTVTPDVVDAAALSATDVQPATAPLARVPTRAAINDLLIDRCLLIQATVKTSPSTPDFRFVAD